MYYNTEEQIIATIYNTYQIIEHSVNIIYSYLHCVHSISQKMLLFSLSVNSQVTFIYIVLLTIQIVSKHLTVSNWRVECQ